MLGEGCEGARERSAPLAACRAGCRHCYTLSPGRDLPGLRIKKKKKKKRLVQKMARIFTGNCECQILHRVDEAQRSRSVSALRGGEAAAAWDRALPGALGAVGPRAGGAPAPPKAWPGGNNCGIPPAPRGASRGRSAALRGAEQARAVSPAGTDPLVTS